MTDSRSPSLGGYEVSPSYQQHLSKVMVDYDHPTGLIEELVSQLADAFWWIKVYRREKEQIDRADDNYSHRHFSLRIARLSTLDRHVGGIEYNACRWTLKAIMPA